MILSLYFFLPTRRKIYEYPKYLCPARSIHRYGFTTRPKRRKLNSKYKFTSLAALCMKPTGLPHALKFFKHCIYVNLHCLFSSLFKFEGHRFIGSQLFSVTVWNYVLLFSIIIIIIIIIIISLLYSAFPLFSFECFASLCRYYLNVVYWLNGRERLFPILHSLLILFLERTKT